MSRNICTVEGCTRFVHGHMLCQTHLVMKRRRERGLKRRGPPKTQTPESRRMVQYKAQRKKEGWTDPRAYERRAGPCECCGKQCDPLCLDHCHVTGALRGWLCRNCNAGIGQLGDDLQGVERAVAYLSRVSGLAT
jgi:hypothetical protein